MSVKLACFFQSVASWPDPQCIRTSVMVNCDVDWREFLPVIVCLGEKSSDVTQRSECLNESTSTLGLWIILPKGLKAKTCLKAGTHNATGFLSFAFCSNYCYWFHHIWTLAFLFSDESLMHKHTETMTTSGRKRHQQDELKNRNSNKNEANNYCN